MKDKDLDLEHHHDPKEQKTNDNKADKANNNQGDAFLSKNFIKGGEWPAFLLGRTSPPRYGVMGQPQEICVCLSKFGNGTAEINYIAGAKAGTRSIYDAMVGCYSDTRKTFREQCPVGYNSQNTVGVHHCHTCAMKHLEKKGAKKFLIPVREPRARLASLIKFQWGHYRSEFVPLLGEEDISPQKVYELYDSDRHEEFLSHLSNAWHSYDYYFADASGETDLYIICIGGAHKFVPQYNYAMERMGAPTDQMYLRLDNGEEGNAYQGDHRPGRRSMVEKEVYREIDLEHELWQTYCVSADDDEVAAREIITTE